MNMSNLERFAAYAKAFEETLLDDDWARLEQYFYPDAVYLPGDGNEAVGRESVLQTLRDSVNSLDRRFDSREWVEEPRLSEAGDTVTLAFTVRYAKQAVTRGLDLDMKAGLELEARLGRHLISLMNRSR